MCNTYPINIWWECSANSYLLSCLNYIELNMNMSDCDGMIKRFEERHTIIPWMFNLPHTQRCNSPSKPYSMNLPHKPRSTNRVIPRKHFHSILHSPMWCSNNSLHCPYQHMTSTLQHYKRFNTIHFTTKFIDFFQLAKTLQGNFARIKWSGK